MRASVIVCTRNRADSIEPTFTALSQLEGADYEVLAIDNSAGEQQEKTAALAARYNVKYIYEPKRGLNVARNTGIRNASGDVLIFTDDDCLPEKNWLSTTLPNFSDPNVWACTSRIVQHTREGAADLFEEVAGQDLGETGRLFVPADVRFDAGFILANVTKVFRKHMKSSAPVPFGVGHGSGMAFRKEVFEKIGRFDERFGSGAKMGGCDDIEMLYRTLKAGHNVVYEPKAIVRHKHRFAAEDVYHTRFDYSRSAAIFLRQYRKDPIMFIMFYGRITQLFIKAVQYKLLRKPELARSFSNDFRGFLQGWKLHRQFEKENLAAASAAASQRSVA
jgi:glycosyltransferase involved in cell wall biosynthesis